MSDCVGNTLGIYIHIPFCKKKCPYCNFYSVDKFEPQKYIKKLCHEIESWGKKISNKSVNTIYFGGGTPSVLSAFETDEILKCIKKNFKILNPEITLEVNPADYECMDFKKLKLAGINRVSVGAQSVVDEELRTLGRRHDFKDILTTCERIKSAGIKNISVDCILGLPGQTQGSLDKFANFCTNFEIPHISAYILKIEKGTQYYKNKDRLKFLSDDVCGDFYLYFSEKLQNLGYVPYEISNFAAEGFESKHNLKYWNLDDYLGLGPSAHSLINKRRFYYKSDLCGFLNSPEICFDGEGGTEEEYIMLRLRLKEGLTNKNYFRKFKKNIPKEIFEKAKKYEKYGFMVCTPESVSFTTKGFLVSNSIISDILF